MSNIRYNAYFKAVTGCLPFDYQQRLAGGDCGTTCHSQIIDIPTGLGKTAAVINAWLWNRVIIRNSKWPRRLVYCLPMRTLVEQTESEVRKWVRNLLNKADELGISGPSLEDLKWMTEYGHVILMDGEDTDQKWDMYPERTSVIIGVQDMLLSRALNRGYGSSHYRWPMHFGLLNTDTLWIMDKPQLMGVGVETSVQLDGIRHLPQWSQTGNCFTWWTGSALDESRFATVDHQNPVDGWEKMTLRDEDRTAAGVQERIDARKTITQAEFVLSFSPKDNHAMELAAFIVRKHVPGTLTLVVVNCTSRARKLYEALLGDKKSGVDSNCIALIHSRFRRVDRLCHTGILFGEGNRIVIATQTVEAGVDVSARLLITELAPWHSLIQRFGLCNRRGEMNDISEIVWIDIHPKDDRDDLILPYSAEELESAREALGKLSDARHGALSAIQVIETSPMLPIVRRRDIIDLFDTTPDLCGQDIDISHYICDTDDADVQFFWRSIPEMFTPDATEKTPGCEELCRVPVVEAQKFIDKKTSRAWQWNSLGEVWEKARLVRAGTVYLIDARSGGYDNNLGWTGDLKSNPMPHPMANGEADAYRKDPLTFTHYWLSLHDHTRNIIATVIALTESLSLPADMASVLLNAAMWHDAGKAHPVFQKMMRGDDKSRLKTTWAKTMNQNCRGGRIGFRHEFASALAWLTAGPIDALERDLVAYLIAAHHGKVRMSIRAMPEENGDPNNPNNLFARGVWHEDKLEPIPEMTDQPIILDLRLMQIGKGQHGFSWLARMIALRDRIGPFKLAYLEAIIRAADMRASREESERFSEVDCSIQR